MDKRRRGDIATFKGRVCNNHEFHGVLKNIEGVSFVLKPIM